jgi:hypothetical protein
MSGKELAAEDGMPNACGSTLIRSSSAETHAIEPRMRNTMASAMQTPLPAFSNQSYRTVLMAFPHAVIMIRGGLDRLPGKAAWGVHPEGDT